MKSHWFEKSFAYDGSQLRSLFGYMQAGVLGDSIVAWRGACDVGFDKMVDGEDLRAKEKICGSDMVHFIVEKFQPHLSFSVALQRLLATIVKDVVEESAPNARDKLLRIGDDIYLDGSPRKKLSISIATVSPVSALVHFAVNVSNTGTPVPTCCLEDLKIAPEAFARNVMTRYSAEIDSLDQASQKVFWVR
ncbi:MAG TPA: DUF366 family protein [Bdellovibrionales bacterium]|nr:DUF366 family protein [Bdellovibrionales bacterium]